MKRKYIIIPLISIVIGLWLWWWIAIFWFGDVYATHKRNEPDRAALTALHSNFQIGMSRTHVLETYYRKED